MENKLNIDRLLKELSDILSEKYGAKITFTATPRVQSGAS